MRNQSLSDERMRDLDGLDKMGAGRRCAKSCWWERGVLAAPGTKGMLAVDRVTPVSAPTSPSQFDAILRYPTRVPDRVRALSRGRWLRHQCAGARDPGG